MRNLNRNESTIYYALYKDSEEAKDSDGLYTGEDVPEYFPAVAIRASVSAARGTSEIDLFGVNTPYTKTVIVDDVGCPIDEHTILWIDRKPTEKDGTAVAHNYEVVQVAKSLNHIAYAVREVKFSL